MCSCVCACVCVCDVSVLCIVCVCLSVMCVCMCVVVARRDGVVSFSISLFPFHCVSASVATHQHMCVHMPQHMCKCEVTLCVGELLRINVGANSAPAPITLVSLHQIMKFRTFTNFDREMRPFPMLIHISITTEPTWNGPSRTRLRRNPFQTPPAGKPRSIYPCHEPVKRMTAAEILSYPGSDLCGNQHGY